MALVQFKDLKAALPPKSRLIGIDQGEKTLGLAISNPELTLASPLKTLMRTKFKQDVVLLAKICQEYDVRGFVIGLPLALDGSEGPRCTSVRHFADNLIAARDVLGFDPAIAFWDERLSTAGVERFLIEQADRSRKKRAKVVDSSAAGWILQGALDRLQNM